MIKTERFLIDLSNLKNGLMKYQNNFLNENQVNNFYRNEYFGIPLLFPANLKYFSYDKTKFFSLKKKRFGKKIFSIKEKKYNQFENYFSYGDIFCSNIKLKNKYIKKYNFITNYNNKLIKKLKKLKKKKLKIGSFQTRNIPHFGHERIIKHLLNFCDIAIINPLIGPKKKGDIRPNILKKVYNFLINKKFKNKVLYMPVYANMFYAGPREAIHHVNLREKLGFDYFMVGRDHAGANNYYDKEIAMKKVKQYKKKYTLKVIAHKGSFFCSSCKKVVLKNIGSCNKKCKLKDISGTEFRKCIAKRKIFNFADEKMQKYILQQKEKLFY